MAKRKKKSKKKDTTQETAPEAAAVEQAPVAEPEPESSAAAVEATAPEAVEPAETVEAVEAAAPAEESEEAEADDEADDEDEDEDEKKTDKVEVEFEAVMSRDDAVAYLEAIVVGLKKGEVTVTHGGRELAFTIPSAVEVEVEASRKGDKEELSFELSWRVVDGLSIS